jgi:hypothetical protein
MDMSTIATVAGAVAAVVTTAFMLWKHFTRRKKPHTGQGGDAIRTSGGGNISATNYGGGVIRGGKGGPGGGKGGAAISVAEGITPNLTIINHGEIAGGDAGDPIPGKK